MSLDVSKMMIRCDSHGCSSATCVPIRLRHYYDDSIMELRGASSASGWIFVSSRPYDRHYCPSCAGDHIRPRNHLAGA